MNKTKANESLTKETSTERIQELEEQLNHLKTEEEVSPKEHIIRIVRKKEMEEELNQLKNEEAISSKKRILKFANKKELENSIRQATEKIHYHKAEIVRLEMIKNGGFPINYMDIPNLTHYTYKMLHSFALFLAEHKIALESCGADELANVIKIYRLDHLDIKLRPKHYEALKDIGDKSKIHYGEKPSL